jgi:ribonuclease E
MPAFRTQNWEARWNRLSRATNDLAILPPIDVLRFGDRYWIEDGHNRVAAALRNGQVEIDAAITDLRSTAATSTPRSTEALAPMLEEGRELRAAGEGRFSAQAASLLASTADESEQGHGHAHADRPADDHETADGVEATATATESDQPAPQAGRRMSRIGRRPSAAAAAAPAPEAKEGTEATEASATEMGQQPRPKRRRSKAAAAPEPDDADDGAALDAGAAPTPETTPAPETS